jgi:hypothetical protein
MFPCSPSTNNDDDDDNDTPKPAVSSRPVHEAMVTIRLLDCMRCQVRLTRCEVPISVSCLSMLMGDARGLISRSTNSILLDKKKKKKKKKWTRYHRRQTKEKNKKKKHWRSSTAPRMQWSGSLRHHRRRHGSTGTSTYQVCHISMCRHHRHRHHQAHRHHRHRDTS